MFSKKGSKIVSDSDFIDYEDGIKPFTFDVFCLGVDTLPFADILGRPDHTANPKDELKDVDLYHRVVGLRTNSMQYTQMRLSCKYKKDTQYYPTTKEIKNQAGIILCFNPNVEGSFQIVKALYEDKNLNLKDQRVMIICTAPVKNIKQFKRIEFYAFENLLPLFSFNDIVNTKGIFNPEGAFYDYLRGFATTVYNNHTAKLEMCSNYTTSQIMTAFNQAKKICLKESSSKRIFRNHKAKDDIIPNQAAQVLTAVPGMEELAQFLKDSSSDSENFQFLMFKELSPCFSQSTLEEFKAFKMDFLEHVDRRTKDKKVCQDHKNYIMQRKNSMTLFANFCEKPTNLHHPIPKDVYNRILGIFAMFNFDDRKIYTLDQTSLQQRPGF